MRNGWPHSEDGRGMTPADQGYAPFGEHPSGGYRYPATRGEQMPAAAQGAHPYAAFDVVIKEPRVKGVMVAVLSEQTPSTGVDVPALPRNACCRRSGSGWRRFTRNCGY